jgi:hypothetical protein
MIRSQPRDGLMEEPSDGATTLVKDGQVEVIAMQAENERLRGLVVRLTEIILRNVVERK